MKKRSNQESEERAAGSRDHGNIQVNRISVNRGRGLILKDGGRATERKLIGKDRKGIDTGDS